MTHVQRPDDAPPRAVPSDVAPPRAVPRDAVPPRAVPRDVIPPRAVPRDVAPPRAVPRDAVPPRAVPPDVARLAGAAPGPGETWLRIVQVHDRITRRVDSALHQLHGLSLTGFEALRRIAEAPGEQASMGEVAEAVGLSRPGVTSTVGRLVAEGLVTRERSGGDKRLLHARLTPAGRKRFAAAAATHDELVAHLLTLLGDDAGVVTDALARVSAAARPRR